MCRRISSPIAIVCPTRSSSTKVGLLARGLRAVGERQPDFRRRRVGAGRLRVGGAEVEEVVPLPWVLRAGDLAGQPVDHGELPVADEPAPGDSVAFSSSPSIDFTG